MLKHATGQIPCDACVEHVRKGTVGHDVNEEASILRHLRSPPLRHPEARRFHQAREGSGAGRNQTYHVVGWRVCDE